MPPPVRPWAVYDTPYRRAAHVPDQMFIESNVKQPREKLAGQLSRSVVIDSIKAIAAQVIVLHHVSLYAPMTEWIALAWPGLVAFFYSEGRLAVQPFLVIGGFLAAQSLGKQHNHTFGRLIWKRYLRLAPQLVIALLLVMLATLCLGDELSQETWLSSLPTLGVFLAHVFFLQDVLAIESMSAGAWYVAIDFQLFGLFALLAYISRLSKHPLSESFAPIVVAAFTVASICIFSRQAMLDAWAIYYLSAYGLGALVAWGRESTRARIWLWITVAVLLLDWLWDPRVRPMLALLTAFCLYGLSHVPWHREMNSLRKSVQFLSDVSYSMFVSHFAVIIVVSGLWKKFQLEGFAMASLVIVIGWLASLAVGVFVQHLYEQLMVRRKPVTEC